MTQNSNPIRQWFMEHAWISNFEKGIHLEGTSEEKWEFYFNFQDALKSIPSYTSPNARISRTSEFVGQVVIEDGAQILPGAYIEGPAYIGKNAFVGNGALIRPGSFLSRGSVIGFQCYSTAALLGPKAGAFHYCGVSRSLLEKNCRLTAYIVTGSARPDFLPILAHFPNDAGSPPIKRGCLIGENSFISSHVVIRPGITIEFNCFIGPFIFVSEDVSSETSLELEDGVKVRKNILNIAEIPAAPSVSFIEKQEEDTTEKDIH